MLSLLSITIESWQSESRDLIKSSLIVDLFRCVFFWFDFSELQRSFLWISRSSDQWTETQSHNSGLWIASGKTKTSWGVRWGRNYTRHSVWVTLSANPKERRMSRHNGHLSPGLNLMKHRWRTLCVWSRWSVWNVIHWTNAHSYCTLFLHFSEICLD